MTQRERNALLSARCDVPNSEKSEQTDHPDSHDPRNLRVSTWDSFELRKTSPREGLLLLKMLLSRVVWEGPQTLSQRDLALVVLVYDNLRTVKDLNFQLVFRRWVVETTLFLHQRSFLDCFTSSHSPAAVSEASRKGAIGTLHAFYGWFRLFRVGTYLRTVNRRFRRPTPPKRFIGVGYRDHGTAGSPSWDGTPGWQEIASSTTESRYSPSRQSVADTVAWLTAEEDLLRKTGLTLTSSMVC